MLDNVLQRAADLTAWIKGRVAGSSPGLPARIGLMGISLSYVWRKGWEYLEGSVDRAILYRLVPLMILLAFVMDARQNCKSDCDRDHDVNPQDAQAAAALPVT